MGNAPAKAKVADVLPLTVAEVNEGIWMELPDPANMPEADVDAELQLLGVDPAEASMEDKTKCLLLVRNPDFWRTHFETHPAKSRVSNWMMVHNKYRDYSKKIVDAAEAAAQAGDGAKDKLPAVTSALESYEKKLVGHAGYEDESLFKFFQDHVQTEGDLVATNLEDLNTQHKDSQFADSVKSAVAAAAEGGAEQLIKLVEAAKAYHEHQLEHMKQEERTLVARWLGLTEEKYQTYRSYVKFPYSFMY